MFSAAGAVSVSEVRRIEGDAAGQQRRQRLRAHVDAIGADRDVDAARVPEARLGGDVFVVGRVDEHRDVDRPAIGDQVGGRDLADLQAAVVDRIADAQRTQFARLQDEAPAGLVLDRRRFVEADERCAGPRSTCRPGSRCSCPTAACSIRKRRSTRCAARRPRTSRPRPSGRPSAWRSSPSPAPWNNPRRAAPRTPGRCARPCT